jgi:small GTP-binding protein
MDTGQVVGHQQLPYLKMVWVGMHAVGKTTALHRLAAKEFKEWVPKHFDSWVATVPENTAYEPPCPAFQIGFWDTAGGRDSAHPDAKQYARLRPLSYPNTDVFVICVAVGISQAELITQSKSWKDEIQNAGEYHTKNMILVGLKSEVRDDMEGSGPPANAYSKQQGEAQAQQLGFAGYLEMSAKTGAGVNEVWYYIGSVGLNKRVPQSPTTGCCVVQ